MTTFLNSLKSTNRMFLVIALLGILVVNFRLAPGQRKPIAQSYAITHAANYDPSLSPDGERMVYISRLMGKEQLFISALDGTHSVQLTNDDADHEDPAWSPDGQKIAFVYVKNDLEIISLINTDGSGMEYLTPKMEKTIHPHWSPDGSQIAYCTDDDLAPPRKNESDIKVINLSTRKIRTVITGGTNTYPSWSPDGTKFAFRRMIGEMNSEVFVANADGSDAHNITNHPAFDGWPAWSPDGKKIAFASNRNSAYQIFIMNADGSDVTLVANTEGRATAPAWSKDGKRIFFPNCWNVDFGRDCEIFAADIFK